jgi:SAM-dependent methyltransferase
MPRTPTSTSGAAGYGEDLAAIHAAGFTGLARDAARELIGRLTVPGRVIDLGCGDGTSARLLTDAGHDVLGIDRSPALIALARRTAPDATFRVGSFVDADLPDGSDAVLAAGEVLGYALDARNRAPALAEVLARAAAALRTGGVMLFDLAGPGRVPPGGRCTWVTGDGWAVIAESRPRPGALERRIVSYRVLAGGRCRRSEELHRVHLHRPADVLTRLRAAGFTARTLPNGYAGAPLPAGLTAFVARRT